MMFLSAYWLGECIDIPSWHTRNYGFQFSCTNSYNDLATALFSNPDDTIKRLFSLGGRQQADPSKCYGRYPCEAPPTCHLAWHMMLFCCITLSSQSSVELQHIGHNSCFRLLCASVQVDVYHETGKPRKVLMEWAACFS